MNLAIHFSLIAAAVTYVMWKNVGSDKMAAMIGDSKSKKSKKDLDDENKARLRNEWNHKQFIFNLNRINFVEFVTPLLQKRGYWRVDCQSASKGLFLGLLCLVGGIIILIIFFVMKVGFADDESILIF